MNRRRLMHNHHAVYYASPKNTRTASSKEGVVGGIGGRARGGKGHREGEILYKGGRAEINKLGVRGVGGGGAGGVGSGRAAQRECSAHHHSASEAPLPAQGLGAVAVVTEVHPPWLW